MQVELERVGDCSYMRNPDLAVHTFLSTEASRHLSMCAPMSRLWQRCQRSTFFVVRVVRTGAIRAPRCSVSTASFCIYVCFVELSSGGIMVGEDYEIGSMLRMCLERAQGPRQRPRPPSCCHHHQAAKSPATLFPRDGRAGRDWTPKTT